MFIKFDFVPFIDFNPWMMLWSKRFLLFENSLAWPSGNEKSIFVFWSSRKHSWPVNASGNVYNDKDLGDVDDGLVRS